jgi:CheY-specific phosphatase CheX
MVDMQLPSPEVVQQEFTTILRQLVFLFAEPQSMPMEFEIDKSWKAMQMDFNGPFSGELMLHLPERLQREVAANFLGLDSDDDKIENSTEDAVGELLNVVCGHILSQWAGEDAAFDLGRPVISQAQPLAESSSNSLAMAFDIEGDPAMLTLTLRESNNP